MWKICTPGNIIGGDALGVALKGIATVWCGGKSVDFLKYKNHYVAGNPSPLPVLTVQANFVMVARTTLGWRAQLNIANCKVCTKYAHIIATKGHVIKPVTWYKLLTGEKTLKSCLCNLERNLKQYVVWKSNTKTQSRYGFVTTCHRNPLTPNVVKSNIDSNTDNN